MNQIIFCMVWLAVVSQVCEGEICFCWWGGRSLEKGWLLSSRLLLSFYQRLFRLISVGLIPAGSRRVTKAFPFCHEVWSSLCSTIFDTLSDQRSVPFLLCRHPPGRASPLLRFWLIGLQLGQQTSMICLQSACSHPVLLLDYLVASIDAIL